MHVAGPIWHIPTTIAKINSDTLLKRSTEMTVRMQRANAHKIGTGMTQNLKYSKAFRRRTNGDRLVPVPHGAEN
jgi:hypothetical protein